MTTFKICKHRGWVGRFNLVYNTQEKTAKCIACANVYVMDENNEVVGLKEGVN